MAKRQKNAKTAKRAPTKQAQPRPPRSKKAGKIDRGPLAVGTFIVAYGPEGCPMSELEKQFGMKAHPMRSKIHAARHLVGFEINYDAERKVYVGQPPKAAV